MPRNTFYAESLGATTTTSTTPQTKATLNFTPTASTDYYALWSTQFGNQSGTTNGFFSQLFFDGTTVVGASVRAAFATDNRYTGFGIYPFTRSSTASTALSIQYGNVTGSNTINAQDARILVIERGPHDAQVSSDAESSTTGGSYVTKATLNFTPDTGGDYLLIASAEINNNGIGGSVFCRLEDTNSIDRWGEMFYSPASNPSDYITWGTIGKTTLTATAQSFVISYASDGTNTSKIKNARIVALRLDDFENNYYAFAYDQTTTTSTSYVDQSSLTQTPLAADHVILMAQMANPGIGTFLGDPVNQQFVEGATTLATNISDCGQGTGSIAEPFFVAYKKTLVNTSTTWKTQFSAVNTSFASAAFNAAISVIQTDVPPTSKAGTDTSALTITESSAVSIITSVPVTDTWAVTITESRALVRQSSRTDTWAMTITESRTLQRQAGVTDTWALTITDASALLTTLAVSDTGAITITDVAAILAIVSRTDGGALTITDVASGFADYSRTDTGALSIADASALTILLDLTDEFTLTLTDTQELFILRLISVLDSLDLNLDDQAAMAAYVSAADTLSLSLDDQAAIFSAFVLSDALHLGFDDNQAVIAFLTRTDDLVIDFTDIVATLVLLSKADSLDLNLDDIAAALVVKAVADSLDIVLAEALVLKVLLERMDSLNLDFRDRMALLARLDRSDDIGLQLIDIANVINKLTAVESLGVYRYDGNLGIYEDDAALPSYRYDGLLPLYEVA